MRIAVLFDAENINCTTAKAALVRLRQRGQTDIRRAVGDFSLASLQHWIDCAREEAIELIMQPALGKGKNAADIRLTIEALDIVRDGRVDTVALVSQDRDFTPLALYLRSRGIAVLGFSLRSPSTAFSAACSSFEWLEEPPVAKPAQTFSDLNTDELRQLRRLVDRACQGEAVHASQLALLIRAEAPTLYPHPAGSGKFIKFLLRHGVVERTDDSANGQIRPVRLRSAS